jgi:DinB family protein
MNFLQGAIEILAATPDRVRRLVEDVCQEELSRQPAEDVFSLRENVLHLRDIDVEGYEKRVARILNESHPFLPDLDGARLARERDYNTQPVAPALEAFAASRAASMALLRAINEGDLDRTAELEGVSEVTLRTLLERWMEHDAGHIADMEALRRGGTGRTTANAA